jgi:hypothetical protein
MGLRIAQYKKDGHVWVDAYAKLLSVRYDNATKTAEASLAVFPTKGDDNQITRYPNVLVKVPSGSDPIVCAYGRISEITTTTQTELTTIENKLLTETNNEEIAKLEKRQQIIKSGIWFKLVGAVEW